MPHDIQISFCKIEGALDYVLYFEFLAGEVHYPIPLIFYSTVILRQEYIYTGNYCRIKPEIRSTVFFLILLSRLIFIKNKEQIDKNEGESASMRALRNV